MMKLYLSDTGQCFTVQASGTDGVASLHDRLASETGIPIKSQILLTAEGKTLDSKATLRDYPGLQKPDAALFLFNRKFILETPDLRKIPRNFYEVDMVSSSCFRIHEFSLEEKSSLDVSHVIDQYQRHFQNQYVQAQAYSECHTKRNERSLAMVRTIDAKNRSLRAAYNSLYHHLESMVRFSADFFDGFARLVKENEALYVPFDADLKNLGKIELHPALRRGTRKTLIDIIPESKMRKWLDTCVERQNQLNQAVGILKEKIEGVRKEVKTQGSNSFIAFAERVEARVSESARQRAEAESILETLKGNLSWVQQLMKHTHHMDDLRLFTSQARNKDATHCRNLGAMREVYESSLTPLQTLYECQEQFHSFFYEKLHTISELQTRIRALRKKLSLYQEGSKNLSQMRDELKKIKNLPQIYRNCVSETKRRYLFQEQFMSIVNTFERKLAKSHEAETELRRKFARENWDNLSSEFFPFLRHGPPKIHINVKNLGKLPKIVTDEELKDALGAEDREAKIQAAAKEISQLKKSLEILAEENKRLKELRENQEKSGSIVDMVVSTAKVTPVEVSPMNVKPDQGALVKQLEEEKVCLQEKIQQLESKVHDLGEQHNEMQRTLEESQKNNAHLEVFVDQLKRDRTKNETELETMSMKIAHLLRENRNYKNKNDQEHMWKEVACTRISYRSFQLHDVALFMRQDGFYEAFHKGAPHRYLAIETLRIFKEKPSIILGKIVQIEKSCATNHSKKDNPYHLPIGTDFYMLTVEVLESMQHEEKSE
uniref:Ubiquitin-like domain-containing protein n=1 Tax=Norrisiella sphaerica TaxID=552664 RepID=A0A7S2QRZ3_9EUKA|mmetsp:Transcript_1598/g.2292  ORF Transcript_1598/g.2292 Transcript_1598/m.2292 type:complete len:773 (+) Transcript_1598:2-2320(+)